MAKLSESKGFDAPIPGENFTSDTRNYPWHRPPQFTDLDEAIEYIGEKLLSEEGSIPVLTFVEAGLSIADITEMFLMMGMMDGRWTLDYALLLAGPTAHIMYIMAKNYGLDCDLGIENKKPDTISIFKAMERVKNSTIDPVKAQEATEAAVEEVQAEQKPATGFMSAKPALEEEAY